tara:strand:- start:1436 stop:2926 length:1491 start_codon:yes stop_codon:yes gene_type:complete
MANWKKVIVSGSAADLASLSLGTALPVGSGGTGATSLTDGGILLGSGTGAVTATSVLTNGQLLIGDGTGDPAIATITAGSGINVTNGAGSITITSTAGGGTVTNVATAGSVNGLTLTGGAITTTGTITLGGTLANVANSALSNSTISGKALGTDLDDLTIGAGLAASSAYNGGTARTAAVGAGTHITVNTNDVAVNTTTLISAISGSIIDTIAGDVNVDTNGVSTIQATAVEGSMLNTNTADTSTIEVSSNTLSVLKVPNALTVDNATIQLNTGTTFDGAGARTISVKDGGIDADALASAVAGTGLSGGGGSALSVDYGSSAGDAVQGNTTITLTQTSGEIDITGTAAQALGGAPSYTIGLADTITGNRTFSNNVNISGDLLVNGTASFQNTTNLQVKDRFVLFASGSGGTGDGGIVVQQATQNVGELFGYDSGALRWGVTSSFAADSAAYTPDAFMSAVTTLSSTNPNTSGPAARYNKSGNIYVSSGDSSIWIYA